MPIQERVGEFLHGLAALSKSGKIGDWNKPVLISRPTEPQTTATGSSGQYFNGSQEIGVRYTSTLATRKHQAFDLEPLRTQMPTVVAFVPKLIKEEVYIIARCDELEGTPGYDAFLGALIGLMRLDLSPRGTVSAMLTLWKFVLDANFDTTFADSARESGMAVREGDLEDLAMACDTTVEVMLESGPPQHSYALLSHTLVISYFCLSILILIKQLMSANFDNYFLARIRSFSQRLGLAHQQKDLLLQYGKPSLNVCNYAYYRIGNRLQFRRKAFALMNMLHKGKQGDWKGGADILKCMFTNLEITHLVLIQKYIIDVAPAILTSTHARSEAPAVFKAMLRLNELGENFPYVRMLYGDAETPELKSGNMVLLTALARHLAAKDNPSYANYEGGGKTDAHRAAFDALLRDYHAAVPTINRTGLHILRAEYEEDDVVAVRGALQRDISATTTQMASFLNALSG